MSPSPNLPGRPRHPAPWIAPAKPIRTLIVDDHHEALQAISSFVENRTRAEVVGIAEDGEQGLALIESLQPDLVLLDLLLPKMSGLEVAAAARQRFPSTRIIMMTVMGSMTTKELAKANGCDGFVAKANLCTELPREMSRVFPPSDREVILLVDDEEGVREMVRRFLAHLPYVVLEANSGAEALQVAERYPGPIRLLLTDVNMPGMSGRELAERLLRTQPDTQVLYMTGGTDDPTLLDGGLPKSAVQVLRKPFNLSTLTQVLREMMDARTGENQRV